MKATTEEEAKAYVEKLSEYESQGYNLTRLRAAKEQMLSNLKKAALALDIMNFSNSIWPSILDETPLSQLMHYFYSDASSVEEWAEAQKKCCCMTIESNTDYINGIKAKKRLSAADKKTITFWENSVLNQQNEIEKIKNTLMARTKTPVVKKEERKQLGKIGAVQEILKIVESHNSVVKAVLNDYLVTDGAELEIDAAGSNLWNEIEQLQFSDEPEEDFDTLYKKMDDLDTRDWDSRQLEKISSLFSDADQIEFMEGLAIDKGYALIKVDTLDQKNKLQQFAETEIWPNYNQQKENIVI
jgi:hypothetical protein